MFIMEFKRIWLIVFILMGAFSVNAQENYFVYLQTENNQPFYARMNNKVISSTATGYMILPKMSEGAHDITIGFPKNEFGEEKFTIEINKKSEGYLLKNFGEKGWSLFNLQTLALVNPNTSNSQSVEVATSTEVRNDPFSQMLATVTKDSALLKKNTPVAAPPVTPLQAIVKTEENVQETVATVLPEKKNTEEVKETVSKADNPVGEKQGPPSEIIYNPEKKQGAQPVKILGVTGRDGSEMIYVDKTASSIDTITVFIPLDKEKTDSEVVKVEAKEVAPSKKEPEFTITPTIVSPVKEENREAKVMEHEKNKTESEIIYKEEAKKPASQVFIIRDDSSSNQAENKSGGSMILLPTVPAKSSNSDCKDLANKNDFLRIRKRMAAEKDNDAMVLAAKRIFKTKCFSTEQIRNLSYLFLSDEGRYMFFDAAYPYTFDTEKFPTLVSQLKDEYYVNRFEAMIQK